MLDFKSLSNDESSENTGAALMGTSVPTPIISAGNLTPNSAVGHHTMEFFEMCAALIIQLAR